MDHELLEVEVVVQPSPPALVGEGPVWDVQRQRLFWIDVKNPRLFICDPTQRTNLVHTLSEMIGSLALRRNGHLILAKQSGFFDFDLDSKTETFIAHPEADKPENRFNDGRCDPKCDPSIIPALFFILSFEFFILV
jgi:sugar lactone lactonase YvrE